MILTFPGTQRQGKLVTFFWLVQDRESGKLSGPMAEVEASSKNLRKLPGCNLQFQIMIFESLSHSYFSNGITCVAVQLVAVSVEPRPSMQGNFLNETRFYGPYKTTLRNKTAKKAL